MIALGHLAGPAPAPQPPIAHLIAPPAPKAHSRPVARMVVPVIPKPGSVVIVIVNGQPTTWVNR